MENSTKIDLNVCDFHVHASSLPISFAHQGIGKIIGDAMGTFLSVEDESQKGSVVSSLRMRVCIDITKPLRRCMNLDGPNRQELQIRFQYERLPNFCYYCGILDHLVKDSQKCSDLVDESGEVPDSHLKYGDWMHTQKKVDATRYMGRYGNRRNTRINFFSSSSVSTVRRPTRSLVNDHRGILGQ